MKMIIDLNHRFGGIRIIRFIFLLIPIIIYYLLINKYIVNIPFGDEFGAALQWLNSYESIDSVRQKFLLLFRQANEHRIFTYYLAVLTDYSVFGMVNFKRLLWAGNLSIILLFFLLHRLIIKDRKNPLILLPIALLVFMPQHEISDWGIVAYGTILQTALVIGSLILLNKPGTQSTILAALIAFTATFSFGNGMFVFLSGYLVLFLSKEKLTQKLLVWSIAMLISIALYFTNYVFRQSFKVDILNNFLDIVQYFLVFFGSIFTPLLFGRIYLILIAGFLVMLCLGFLLIYIWKSIKDQTVVLSVLFFVLLSAAAASVTRISFGIEGATAPRYILLQAVFLSLLYILWINTFYQNRKLILSIILPLSLVLFGARLNSNIKRMTNHKKHLENIVLNYHVDFENIKTFGPSPNVIKTLLDQSQKNGFYFPPGIGDFYKEIIKLDLALPESSEIKVKFALDKVTVHEKFVKIQGWVFLENGNHYDQRIVVIFKSGVDGSVFSTIKRNRPDVVNHFEGTFNDIPTASGFELVLDKERFVFSPGNYLVGLGVLHKEKIVGLKFSDKYVTFN